MSNQTADVLIIGGGIVGLTAALLMQQLDFTVAVLDATSLTLEKKPESTRVFAINAASNALFQSINVWEHIPSKHLSPYTHMQVWDAQSSGAIHFDAREVAAKQLGFILEESVIKKALLEKIAEKKEITLYPNYVNEEVNPLQDGIEIKGQNQTFRGQLLMIAEGAHSHTRELLKVPLTSWPYNQCALTATIETEKPHQQTAYQIFHPEGPLAFLPLHNAHQCSIVWTTNAQDAHLLLSMSQDDFNSALKEAFRGTLGNVKKLSPLLKFPLTMRHVQQYVGEHWLLLGDAAHTIHPLAGLGLNLGLADISEWKALLTKSHHNLQSNLPLARYQRARKHALWQVIALMEALKTLFGSTSMPITTLRGLGLNAFNACAPVKRLLIEQAMGVEPFIQDNF